ncbi:DNA recombination protein RmuC [bacterium]|nr:DNA recombination protein RmuC [bacterium]
MNNYQFIYLALFIITAAYCAYLLWDKKKLFKQYFEILEEKSALAAENVYLKDQIEKSQTKKNQDDEYLKSSFENLANELLDKNQKKFMEMAKTTLQTETDKSKQHLDKKQEHIELLLSPLKDTLNQYQKQLFDMEKSRGETFGKLENELTNLVKSNLKLSDNTLSLKNALKRPHVRGRWGEVQLKNCIELAGMSEHSDVIFQDAQNVDDKLLIPDMTVNMPGGGKVVVDAKTPIEAFIASIEAHTEEEKAKQVTRHGKHIKKHIQDLSSKEYQKNIKGSADFTVMFLPNESFLYAALEADPNIMEYAIERKILITTPPTLIGLLKVIHMGWNEKKLTENAQKISELGKELHKRVCDFTDSFQGLGTHLDKAKAEYDKSMSRLQKRVLVQTKRFEDLGVKSKKDLPEIEFTDKDLLSDIPSAEPDVEI